MGALDSQLAGLFDGASLPAALGIALVLGLRHASDPDHLVAVTSLVAADGGDPRAAARLGVSWGVGHAAVLLALGIPLIGFRSELPGALESGAEKAIAAVIIVLAARVIWKWVRGDFRTGRHWHAPSSTSVDGGGIHRHLRHGDAADHPHRAVRSPRQALGIGVLHGLAGTGAVVVLLLAALPSQVEAGLALAVFGPMSIVSMALFTTAFAWLLTRRLIDPVYRTVLVPAFGVFGLSFGLWYTGLL
jgi:ABC-type nickel/cobalt efflux system permease component RcnA